MSNQVPDVYEGRIPAKVKHALLKSYLEKLVLIIGMNARSKGSVEICYVDCFAGPWGSEDAKLEGTSISLSLKTLAACKEKLASHGVDARMRALFVEQEPDAFNRLSAYLSNDAPKSVEAKPMKGDFVALRSEILDWTGKDVVAIEDGEQTITVTLWHCKYSSGAAPGNRVKDLYEVCGQAQKSTKWTWNFPNLVAHLTERETKHRAGRPTRFVRGSLDRLVVLRKASRRKYVVFRVGIVQPGLSKAGIENDHLAILGSTSLFLRTVTNHPLVVISS